MSKYPNGIDESMSVDQCKHSVFGSSKVAADIMVQEYGRYFGMKTVSFRGGCLTGPQHAGVELHGFLSYIIKSHVEDREYTIFGYGGKQVRDQIHSFDVITAMDAFVESPRPGEVYNIGGGKENSMSVKEVMQELTSLTGKPFKSRYEPVNRIGDHICYYTDMSKFRSHYPTWNVTRDIRSVMREMLEHEIGRKSVVT
jgi:CDP-paratose 2-epimerase